MTVVGQGYFVDLYDLAKEKTIKTMFLIEKRY